MAKSEGPVIANSKQSGPSEATRATQHKAKQVQASQFQIPILYPIEQASQRKAFERPMRPMVQRTVTNQKFK